MVRIKFFAQDKTDKTKVESNAAYFNELDEAVAGLIELNRSKLIHAMPNARVFAVIVQEGEEDDNLFV